MWRNALRRRRHDLFLPNPNFITSPRSPQVAYHTYHAQQHTVCPGYVQKAWVCKEEVVAFQWYHKAKEKRPFIR